MPSESGFKICRQNDFGVSSSMNNSESCFVIRPFESGLKPMFIHAEMDQGIDPSEIVLENMPLAPLSESVNQDQYLKTISAAIERSKEINGKIVLSRIQEQRINSIDIGESLKSLRGNFPDSFIYLLISSERGIWMGASPETLVEKDFELYSTMALAGTKWGDDLFSQKEFDEQMLVSRDIMDRLSDEVIEVGDVHEMAYGELRHLRTNVRWQSEDSIIKFAELLHPTSAVSGFPRKEAYQFVLANETHQRSLYSGYLGLINPNEKSQLFVNLRCMKIYEGQIRVYVGGGINAKSEPLSEWEEIERKSNSVMEALIHG